MASTPTRRLVALPRGGPPDDRRLGALVELGPQLVPGCDLASVSRWDDGPLPITLACTDEITGEVDRLEHRHGEGPTLSAIGSASFHKIVDFAFDRRWPIFGEAVSVQTPVRAALAYRLATPGKRVTLTLYAYAPDSFGPDAIAPAAMLAVHVRSLLVRTVG